jgi:uncharacterized protein (TIGR00297 family)
VNTVIPLFTGFLLSGLISYLAWRLHSLTYGGAWMAIAIGGLIFSLGGVAWAILLIAFFVSSSLLSKAFKTHKAALSEKFAKGIQRDATQVFANGGLGALLASTQFLIPDQHWPWIGYAGAMATVNADTWATELGVLNSSPPRLITTGKKVERGTSGGISFLGTVAALSGAALIASLGELINPHFAFCKSLCAISLAGLAGSLMDSMLGATGQAGYQCTRCSTDTEHYPLHTCGKPTVLVKGWPWLQNDAVNFISSIFGALAAILFWVWL